MLNYCLFCLKNKIVTFLQIPSLIGLGEKSEFIFDLASLLIHELEFESHWPHFLNSNSEKLSDNRGISLVKHRFCSTT